MRSKEEVAKEANAAASEANSVKEIRDNEAFYDENIAPIMDRLITMCRERGIPMLADFQLTAGYSSPANPRGGMHCTSRVIVPGEAANFAAAQQILSIPSHAFTVLKVDAESDLAKQIFADEPKPKVPTESN